MLLRFWGVHGSLPRPGPSTLKYGGNTACVEVRFGDALVIFDAGSGIRELGEDIVRGLRRHGRNAPPVRGHIFFSHLHWDHVQGFPFFAPAFMPRNEFHLYGGRNLDSTIFRIISEQMSRPNFPVTLADMQATLVFHDLDPGSSVTVEDATVRTEMLNHPGGSFGYRLERDGKVVVYASDTEHVDGVDSPVLHLARDADLLIFDGMFTPEQYVGLSDGISRRSWGHSTWEGAVRMARIANVGRLVLFHHGNDDQVVEEMERAARQRFPHTIAAFEGLEIEV